METEQQQQSTPGWVRDLEKKRLRPHKLAHDIGAGAQCLSCGDACPGLDLHFWRKTCRNCKCGREKHDVATIENEYQQFEILLGAGHKRTLKKTYQLRVGGNEEADVSFDWVPPNTTPDMAERYMLEIPASQRPVSGSEGAQKRREQLERQVPPHDVDPSRCHSLSDAEVSGLESYRQHLREGAVGQGRVATLAAMLKELRLPYAVESSIPTTTKLPGVNHPAVPFTNNYSQPEVNANNEEFFPPPPSPGTLSQLQAFPSPLSAPSLPKSAPPYMQRPSAFLPQPADQNQNVPTLQGDKPNEKVPKVQGDKPNQKVPKSVSFSTESPLENESGHLQQDIPTVSRGFTDRSQLGLNFPKPLPMIEEVKSPGFESDPVTNLTARATRYDNNNAAGELPGELAGLHLTSLESNNVVCRQCSLPVAPGDVVVTADRAGPGAFWHPACFICCSCKELLVDLIYFHKDDRLFCGRHFAEEVNIPRCSACDELIFTTEYTLAEGLHFHVRHFCCIECDVPLAGMKYVSRDGQPCCLDCYRRKYSKICNSCKELIGPSESSVIWGDLHWHAEPRCFRCAACQRSLLNSKFAVRDQQSLCSKECIQAFLSQRTTAV